MIFDKEYSTVELLAKVREYEHALEHVAEQNEYHSPSACTSCQQLAQSALNGVNREDFRELAADELEAFGEDEFVRVGWSIHPTPDKKRFMSPHDKNSVHMDGCIPLFVRRDHLEARGIDLR